MTMAGLLGSVCILGTLSSHHLALMQWDLACPGQLYVFSVPKSGPGKGYQLPAYESSELRILQWVNRDKHFCLVLGSLSPVDTSTVWLLVHPRRRPMLPL